MLSYKTVFLALLSSSSLALPIRREVPQEHSHQQFLTSVTTSLQKNNPSGIVDAVFGVLGDAAAAGGAGKITDVECLQQATADQAFTNAKAAGDVPGQVDALIYRALERNTGSVGGVSKPCTSITAVNPEIAAIQQHQDPASPNAAAINKAIVLELAKQIVAVGGDALDALKSGTFAAGNLGDPTGKGNTCDDANDAEGCIFTQNLLVPDASDAEISAAVAGATIAAPATTAAATTAAATTAATTAVAAATTGAATSSGAANTIGNFGSCSVPQIQFAAGFDGRKETSFEPVDKTSYNHGSAQAIDIITEFICDTLTNSCGADSTAKNTCSKAKAAADTGAAKTGIQADLFNGVFGIVTNFAAVTALDDQGEPIAGSTGESVSVATTAAATTAVATTAAVTTAAASSSTGAASASASSSANVQTFTGALGGALAPPVIPGGKGFVVEGDEFIQKAGALGRSCDTQHNECANIANSSGVFAVSECDAQNTACHAAISA